MCLLVNSFLFHLNNLLIDLSLEQTDLESKVQEIMHEVPSEISTIIEKLIEHILSDYFFNFFQSSGDQQFRDVSSLFTLTLMMIERYPYLIVPLCLQTRDYSYLIQTYPHASIIHHLDPDSLRSVTFIECLFKTKYFLVHSQDLFAMAKLFASFYTGIILVDPENSRSLVDFSHIMIIRLMSYIDSQLKQKLAAPYNTNISPTESYGLLYNSLSALSCILFSMNSDDLKAPSFGRDFKVIFLSIIKQVFHALSISSEIEFKILKGYGNIDAILANVLDAYYDQQLSVNSCNRSQIETAKNVSYCKFLTSQEQQFIVSEHQTSTSINLSNSKYFFEFLYLND